MVLQENEEDQDLQEPSVKQDHPDQLERLVPQVVMENSEKMDFAEITETQENKAQEVHQEQMEPLVFE